MVRSRPADRKVLTVCGDCPDFRGFRRENGTVPLKRTFGGRRPRLERLEERLLLSFDPSAIEQELLEDINRMRTNPQAELGVLFSSIDPLHSPDSEVDRLLGQYGLSASQVRSEWGALTSVQPVAWHEALSGAALAHSEAMVRQGQESHQLPGESSILQRAQDAGYPNAIFVYENVTAGASSLFQAYSDFTINWDDPSRTDRSLLMGLGYHEVGIGIVARDGAGSEGGPLAVTVDYGDRWSFGYTYLLGVVYDDANASGRYDAGEGRGGVDVEVVGAEGVYATTTMTAGGYQLKLPPGSYAVIASGGGLEQPLEVPTFEMKSSNVKVDLRVGVDVPAASAPAASNDAYQVGRDSALRVAARGVLANDSAPSGGALTASRIAGPSHGTLSLRADGSFDYTPNPGFVGTDAFYYRAKTPAESSNTAKVTIHVAETAPAEAASVGLYVSVDGAFFLKDRLGSGIADHVFGFGPGGAGWLPIVGDWDGDGIDTTGVYAPASSVFYLKNSFGGGASDTAFGFGPAGLGWTPIVGDWNGDGIDTVGLYDPATSTFFLKNGHAGGIADAAFAYGLGGHGWQPLVGDWNADGIDTVGLFSPDGAVFYLSNGLRGGAADEAFVYGPSGLGWKPLAGDWNADGIETVGLYAPATSGFYLRNSHAGGAADEAFAYGPPALGWQPLVGGGAGPGGSALRVDGGLRAAATEDLLTQTDLGPIVDAAIVDWARAGLAADRAAALDGIAFVIADLPGSLLGLARDGKIYLDRDAAGRGWFVDATPEDDEEFLAHDLGADLRAIDPRVLDRVDLRTVVSHELGHVLGLDDVDGEGVMQSTLRPGVRREPHHM